MPVRASDAIGGGSHSTGWGFGMATVGGGGLWHDTWPAAGRAATAGLSDGPLQDRLGANLEFLLPARTSSSRFLGYFWSLQMSELLA